MKFHVLAGAEQLFCCSSFSQQLGCVKDGIPGFPCPKWGAQQFCSCFPQGRSADNSSFCLIWGRNSTLSLVGWWNSLVASRGGTAGQDMRQNKGKWDQNVPGEEIGRWRGGQALGQALQGGVGTISLQVFKKWMGWWSWRSFPTSIILWFHDFWGHEVFADLQEN